MGLINSPNNLIITHIDSQSLMALAKNIPEDNSRNEHLP